MNPLPKFTTETNDIDEISLAEEQLKVTEIKIEDGIEGKATLGNLLPSTGSSKTHTEIVKEDAGLVHTSVTTFYSPVTDINNDGEVREGIRTQAEKGNDLEDGGWLEMVQSYKAPEGKVKCAFCEIAP